MGMDAWQRPEAVDLAIKGVLGPSQPSSGSRAFPVLGSDGRRWYVKVLNNPQGGQIVVTEYLISGVGMLIGAPVCEVRPISISDDFAAYQVESGPRLEVGIASASLAIADVVEMRADNQILVLQFWIAALKFPNNIRRLYGGDDLRRYRRADRHCQRQRRHRIAILRQSLQLIQRVRRPREQPTCRSGSQGGANLRTR